MKSLASMLLCITILLPTMPVHASDLQYQSLIGKWAVVGVAVDDPNSVQKLVKDDPSLMGAVVEFRPGSIVWISGTKERPIDPKIDDCITKPTLTSADHNGSDAGKRVIGGFNIICGADVWGPGAIVVPINAHALTLYWFDNAILAMRRRS